MERVRLTTQGRVRPAALVGNTFAQVMAENVLTAELTCVAPVCCSTVPFRFVRIPHDGGSLYPCKAQDVLLPYILLLRSLNVSLSQKCYE